MTAITRRAIIAGTAATAGAATLGSLANAAAPLARLQGPGVYRLKLGSYQLTALYDGIWPVKIEDNFIRNVSAAEVNAALAAGFLAPGILPISFTALLVNTGRKLVLIDTGTAGQVADSAGSMLGNLAVAGIKPAAIDTILISHFHPDHINGIKTKDGAKVFPNAEILVPEPEWTYWMDDGNLAKAPSPAIRKYFLNARRIFRDIAKDIRRFKPGAEVAPGIASLAAFGHTPGHTAFAVSSGAETLLVMSDTARDPCLFIRHPQWQPSFDMDGPMAAAARIAMLDRAASDRMLVHGYHFPFPATGHIARDGKGFDLVPVLWQPL